MTRLNQIRNFARKCRNITGRKLSQLPDDNTSPDWEKTNIFLEDCYLIKDEFNGKVFYALRNRTPDMPARRGRNAEMFFSRTKGRDRDKKRRRQWKTSGKKTPYEVCVGYTIRNFKTAYAARKYLDTLSKEQLQRAQLTRTQYIKKGKWKTTNTHWTATKYLDWDTRNLLRWYYHV